METNATATATVAEPVALRARHNVPAGFHVAAAAWLAGMLLFANVLPDTYEAAMQEDRFVEWWTAALFACAGVIRLIAAIRTRRVFDALVALFCIFVAGEEFSWGQRLLGFTPPDYFLAHNTQQELSLHNFADVFGKPKGVLMTALAGFGIGLPLVSFTRRGRVLLDAVGATAPARVLMPWFAAAVALLVWYPFDYTGEWVETLAGALFLVATPVRSAWPFTVAALAAVALTALSTATVKTSEPMVACARSETDALLDDVAQSVGVHDGLVVHRIHKRFKSAHDDNYFSAALSHFSSVHCEREAKDAAARRRQFAIDPWGLAYWIRSEPSDTDAIITVYSFGPNRRRDSKPGAATGDDVVRVGRIRF